MLGRRRRCTRTRAEGRHQRAPFPDRDRLVEPLLEQVTAARVKSYFAGVVQGEVVRYELPNLSALNFVMDQALGGGVTRSLALDAHGKSLSSALLDLDIIPAPDSE